MQESSPPKKPPSNVVDKVRVTSPTPERGKEGTIVEVLEPLGDLVYRYHVRFSDGLIGRLFGFELILIDSFPGAGGYKRAS